MYCVYGYLRAYYVCVHLYGYVQMRARGCTSEFVHVHIRVCVRIECVSVRISTFVHTIHMCVRVYTRVRVSMCTRMYVLKCTWVSD